MQLPVKTAARREPCRSGLAPPYWRRSGELRLISCGIPAHAVHSGKIMAGILLDNGDSPGWRLVEILVSRQNALVWARSDQRALI